METETLSDASRVERNAQVLDQTEAEIATLESQFVRLQELRDEEQRLRSEWEKTQQDETALLGDESLSEAEAIKRLISVRSRKDVFQTRLAAQVKRIKDHVFDIRDQGETVRHSIGVNLVGRLQMNRRERSEQIVTELFPRYTALNVSVHDLARCTKMCIEADHLENEMSQVSHRDNDQELDALRNARSWFLKVKGLIELEPGLDLTRTHFGRQTNVESQSQSEAAVAA